MNENARRSTGDINTRSEKGEYRIPSRSPCTRRVPSPTRASVKGVPRDPHGFSNLTLHTVTRITSQSSAVVFRSREPAAAAPSVTSATPTPLARVAFPAARELSSKSHNPLARFPPVPSGRADLGANCARATEQGDRKIGRDSQPFPTKPAGRMRPSPSATCPRYSTTSAKTSRAGLVRSAPADRSRRPLLSCHGFAQGFCYPSPARVNSPARTRRNRAVRHRDPERRPSIHVPRNLPISPVLTRHRLPLPQSGWCHQVRCTCSARASTSLADISNRLAAP